MAKPAWQPQPAPPAQTTPGVDQGRNGRPPGTSGSPAQTPLPQAGQITTQRPQTGGVAPGATPTYTWKSPSPVYPEIAPGRYNYNPLTGEMLRTF